MADELIGPTSTISHQPSTTITMDIKLITAMPPEATAPSTLREAAQQFESLFIAQMMQAMRRTAPESGLMGNSNGLQIFREMLDEETARQIASTGGFGIGDILYQQLSRDSASAAGADVPSEAPSGGTQDNR